MRNEENICQCSTRKLGITTWSSNGVRGTSGEKLYQELGFESLQKRRCYRKLCCLFKIINNQSPKYLFQLVPSPSPRDFSRNSENISQLRTKHDFLKISFFPSTIKGWNNLDPQIRKSKSMSISKINILKFIRPKPNNLYYCQNPKGIKLLTRLRLGLSHLRERNLSTAFRAASSLLHCPTYTNERLTLLNKIKSINCTILQSSDAGVTAILLFGDNTLKTLLISSFWIQQLNTSYLLKDLKAPF